jgi:UDP-glucuronate decarboxylase
MKLFFTGGTGFFGKAMLDYWQKTLPSFDKIFILSRDPAAFIQKYSDLTDGLNIVFIKGDILKASEIELEDDIDYVIHAATDSTIGSSLDRLDIYTQITHGTEEVLKFAASHNCKRFLLASSGGVYGPQPVSLEKITEDYLGMPDPLDPNNSYGVGKRAAEHLCALYSAQYDFDYVIARCFTFVGEYLPLNAHFAVGNFVRDALWSDEIIVKGNGASIRSYLDQKDLALWLNKILRDGVSGTAYNVGSDKPISIIGIANLVRDTISTRKEIKVLGCDSDSFSSRYIPDITKAKKELSLQVNISLEQSIRNMLEKCNN